MKNKIKPKFYKLIAIPVLIPFEDKLVHALPKNKIVGMSDKTYF